MLTTTSSPSLSPPSSTSSPPSFSLTPAFFPPLPLPLPPLLPPLLPSPSFSPRFVLFPSLFFFPSRDSFSYFYRSPFLFPFLFPFPSSFPILSFFLHRPAPLSIPSQFPSSSNSDKYSQNKGALSFSFQFLCSFSHLLLFPALPASTHVPRSIKQLIHENSKMHSYGINYRYLGVLFNLIKEATSEEEENGSRFSMLNLQFSPFPEIPTPLPISEMELPSFYPSSTPPSGDPSSSLLPMDSYPAENQFSSRFSTNFISNFIVKQSSGEKSEEKEVESEKNIKKEIKKQILEEMLARTVKSILQDKFKKLNKKNQIKNAKKFTNKLEKILKNLILPIFPENEIFWREKLMKRLKSKFDGVNFDEKCEKEPCKFNKFKMRIKFLLQ